MSEPTSEPVFGADDAPLDDVVDEVAEHNRDPLTRREALEQELASAGRSEEGEDVGDHIE